MYTDPTKTTDDEPTNRPDLGAAAPLDEQPRPVPTNTYGVYAPPQGGSAVDYYSVCDYRHSNPRGVVMVTQNLRGGRGKMENKINKGR